MTTKKQSAKPQDFNFEVAMEKLESIAHSLEDSDTSLEQSMKAFEEGVKLTREAQEYLLQTQQRIKLLIEDNGEPVIKNFHDIQDDK